MKTAKMIEMVKHLNRIEQYEQKTLNIRTAAKLLQEEYGYDTEISKDYKYPTILISKPGVEIKLDIYKTSDYDYGDRWNASWEKYNLDDAQKRMDRSVNKTFEDKHFKKVWDLEYKWHNRAVLKYQADLQKKLEQIIKEKEAQLQELRKLETAIKYRGETISAAKIQSHL